MAITHWKRKGNGMFKTILTIAIIYASMFAGARVGQDNMNRSAQAISKAVKSSYNFIVEKGTQCKAYHSTSKKAINS